MFHKRTSQNGQVIGRNKGHLSVSEVIEHASMNYAEDSNLNSNKPMVFRPRYPPLTARTPTCQALPSGGTSSLLPLDQRSRLLKVLNSYPQIAELRQWLTDAPKMMENTHGSLLSYTLGTQETISCVYWNGQHYITGTDIVKILRFRFACMNRPVGNVKKFEEGVFSDLRNLKANEHASLEEPKSEFLEFLYKHNCIRTQKKQKVFYWYEVRHDDLMLEAFERDAKRQNQAMNINNFLQAQQARLSNVASMAGGLGGRLMPRMQPYPMAASPYMYYPQMEEWDSPALKQDPAEEYLEDNLSLYWLDLEPAPKSPRLQSATTVVTPPPTHIDPSLLSALPAKAQRKVHQQARVKETSQKSALGVEVVKANGFGAELKDPLLHDPFSAYPNNTADDLIFDLFDRPVEDPFLL